MNPNADENNYMIELDTGGYLLFYRDHGKMIVEYCDTKADPDTESTYELDSEAVAGLASFLAERHLAAV